MVGYSTGVDMQAMNAYVSNEHGYLYAGRYPHTPRTYKGNQQVSPCGKNSHRGRVPYALTPVFALFPYAIIPMGIESCVTASSSPFPGDSPRYPFPITFATTGMLPLGNPLTSFLPRGGIPFRTPLLLLVSSAAGWASHLYCRRDWLCCHCFHLLSVGGGFPSSVAGLGLGRLG
jgi:hypothetical protein